MLSLPFSPKVFASPCGSKHQPAVVRGKKGAEIASSSWPPPDAHWSVVGAEAEGGGAVPCLPESLSQPSQCVQTATSPIRHQLCILFIAVENVAPKLVSL